MVINGFNNISTLHPVPTMPKSDCLTKTSRKVRHEVLQLHGFQGAPHLLLRGLPQGVTVEPIRVAGLFTSTN